MRLAVLIISLCLAIAVGLQSCAVTVGGDLSGQEAISEAGAVGILVALLFAVGAAFVMAFPMISACVFTMAGLLALGFAAESADLYVWAAAAIGLAVLSIHGSRELARMSHQDDS